MKSLSESRRGGHFRRIHALAVLSIPLLVAPILSGAPSDEARASSSTPGDSPASSPTNGSPSATELKLDEPKTVTLITGDVVTMHPGGSIDIEPGPNRDHITFDQRDLGESLLVVPSDSAPLLDQGKLDQRLFDITYLIGEGYDDASRPELPLIVQGKADKVREIASTPGSKVKGRSRHLKMSLVAQNKRKDKGKLWARVSTGDNTSTVLPTGVEKVWLDGMSHVTLDESVPQIGAPEVWESGYTGEGVTVAVLDTGIDATHPDLEGKVAAKKGFSDNPLSGAFRVDGLDGPVRYMSLQAALPVPDKGSSDPLVHVGRACVESEGDELLADPEGKVALIPRGLCPFGEKFDAAVEAGATGVVIYNNESGLNRGHVFGSDDPGATWGVTISDSAGAELLELLDASETVNLEFIDKFPGDTHGHGTHVASTIAGTGAASDGAFRGVAPDASLLNGKVCDDFGDCQDSWVIAGMEWAAANGADIVNVSISGAPTDGTDPVSQAVNTLTESRDVLFVIAAGNSGSRGPTFVGTPGVADAALTVGAVDKKDQLADFSSRGPRVGDHAVKPEITAPGVGIVAARGTDALVGEPVNESYIALNGTSMATPHVAGAAALLAQTQPGFDAAALKSALASTATNGGELWFRQGTGRVDVARAVNQRVYADASVNFGMVTRADRDSRQVTYSNYGDSVVKLKLDSSLRDIQGNPIGKLNLSKSRLTIPPGRQRAVDVTADPSTLTAPGGPVGGIITATGPDVRVRTAIGLGLQRDTEPLADDWEEVWTEAYPVGEPETLFDLKGAAMGPNGEQLFMYGAKGFTLDAEIIVMAVDVATREQLWVAKQPVSYASWGPAPGMAVAPDGSTVYVTQNVYDWDHSRLDVVTMAFNNASPEHSRDPELGELVWQSSYDGINVSSDAHPGEVKSIALSPDGQTLIVLATQRQAIDGGSCESFRACTTSIATIAYDAISGEQVWFDRYKGPTNVAGLYDQAGDVTFSKDGEIVFVNGLVKQREETSSSVTIGYVVRGEQQGTKRWVTQSDVRLSIDPGSDITLSEDGKRVFVANAVTASRAPFDEHIRVQAIDAHTGERLWSSEFAASDHGYLPGHTTLDRGRKGGLAVSPTNDMVFVTGQHCEGATCTGAFAQVTVAFDQQSGERRWFHLHESAGRPIAIGSLTPAEPLPWPALTEPGCMSPAPAV